MTDEERLEQRMKPTEEVRAAAQKLRHLATEATPAPWSQRWDHQELQVHGPGQKPPYSVAEWTYAVATVEPQATEQRAECDTADADWIATMHPGVGALLAQLLDNAATTAEGLHSIFADSDSPAEFVHPDTLAVARAINAGAQP